MEKPRICIDIDNVIAQTDAVMRDVISEVTGGRVNLRYDDIKRFNYWECTDPDGQSISRDEWHVIHDRFSEPDRLLSIKPFSEVERYLARLSQRYTIHFATSRLPKARRPTIEWLESSSLLFDYDLHFLRHGEKHLSLGTFAGAVEDDLDQATAFADSGITSFVLAHPWNEVNSPPPRLIRVKDWPALTEQLLALGS